MHLNLKTSPKTHILKEQKYLVPENCFGALGNSD
jgi:hypothetical protein